jgi:hypothetical protein
VANLHPGGTVAGAHGTFIAASVLGDAVNATGESGWHADRGGAWDARMVAGSHVGLGTTVPFLEVLFAGAAEGARIHTNSWHDQRTSTQSVNTDAVNIFAWNDEQQLVIGAIANMATGYKLGPPGIAKNAVGVSAARKTDPMQHGQGLSGPYESRRKPDFVAVGCDVVSALVDTACETGVYDATLPCSTSDATAHAAAAAALVRQYYVQGWYPSGTPRAADKFIPTGALVKATLVNSTRDMTSVAGYPSDKEGWGIITLDRTLFFPDSARQLRLWDVSNNGPLALTTETVVGETNGHEYVVLVSSSIEPLKVTLVWTDDPGNAALVNDLDLEILDPKDESFLGNHFAGGFSETGGTPDTDNNVEQVLIDSPASGQWKIRVKATAVAIGAQGYALIATGRFGDQLRSTPSPVTNLVVN